MDRDITRRDFIQLGGAGLVGARLAATGLGAGAFAGCLPDGARDGGGVPPGDGPPPLEPFSDALGPEWYGPGGVGDYASSHGNTPELVRVAHRLRDARHEALLRDAVGTNETYDIVIVGGGLAGLAAAHHFRRLRPDGRGLLLDNHPVFGGEAKRNEFEVNGVRIIGPQGSNDFSVPPATGEPDDYFTALGIPREFEYAAYDGDLRIPLDNYGFMHWVQNRFSVGHFFPEGGGRWVHDLWDDLSRAPWPEEVRQGFARWRSSRVDDHTPADAGGAPGEPPRWLDRLTLKEYYEETLGLPPEVTAYVDPILASIIGLGCGAVSAWWGFHFGLPGFADTSRYDGVTLHSFPGGNAGFARFFVKNLIPDAIAGERELGDLIEDAIDLRALDRDGQTVRIRLDSTAIDVRHVGARSETERVRVTYVHGGRAYTVEARGVVMASGGWMNRHVCADLPGSHRAAYESFVHAPILVANVALTNWRFLERLGVAACMYEGDFGFSCNIRRPMVAGSYRPPFGPDHPTVLTFYTTFDGFPGTPAEQGTAGRMELLSTSFADYERRIREQMTALFASGGFDPRTDVAGIVLNRWGHAYVAPGPGFFFGRNGRPAPPDVIREPFGRVAIGHSELRGHQNWTGATGEGRRALEELLAGMGAA